MRLAWVSVAPGDAVLRPTSIVNLSKPIESSIEAHPDGCVVILDGLEYLVFRNGFDAILLFVEHLNEVVTPRKAIVLMPLSPATLGRKELAKLERDLEVADVDVWKSELDVRDWSQRLSG